MSAYLGPIHYWLYDKITLFEKLERNLFDAYKEKYGEPVQQIFDTVAKTYGEPIDTSLPLEEVIDPGNIHGWLQNKISIAETREAAFLTKIFHEKGQESIDMAAQIYRSQGEAAGNICKQKETPTTAPELFKALNNYILDGMPCDHVNRITVSEDNLLEWVTESCLHIGYWKAVDADPNTFYMLRSEWVAGFVSHGNPDYEYTFTLEKNRAEHLITHQISKQ